MGQIWRNLHKSGRKRICLIVSGSWIQDLIEDNQAVETPTSWIYWSAVFVISSAAANAYTLRTIKGNYLYYPNLYIMLLGESGLGKGFPVNLAKRLLQEADITRVIAGRSSIQAIIKEGSTSRSRDGKPIIVDSRMAIVNGELSSAIIGDPQALEILTDLFDRSYHDKGWVNLLKGDGAEKLKDPYVTCLFGSSPAHFYNSIPHHNIEGGYIARNLIVYEEKRSKDVDLLDSEEESIEEDKFTNYIIPKYIPHLVKIGASKARLYPNESARKLYNTWRREWRATQKQYNDKTGFINRVPDHALKVAMCICLARYDNVGVIIESDIREAITQVTNLVYASQKSAEGGGLDPMAAQTKKVVDYLIMATDNQMARKDLLIRGYGDYDSTTLDKIIDTLMEMKWIKRQKIGIGVNTDWLIILAGEPKESYERFKEQNDRRN